YCIQETPFRSHSSCDTSLLHSQRWTANCDPTGLGTRLSSAVPLYFVALSRGPPRSTPGSNHHRTQSLWARTTMLMGAYRICKSVMSQTINESDQRLAD